MKPEHWEYVRQEYYSLKLPAGTSRIFLPRFAIQQLRLDGLVVQQVLYDHNHWHICSEFITIFPMFRTKSSAEQFLQFIKDTEILFL